MLHPDFPFISAFKSASYHLVMPKSFLNCPCLFIRTAGLFWICGLRLAAVLTFDDPVLSFYPGDIQMSHMKPVLFLHPVPDLFVYSPLPEAGHIHVFEREFNSDILTRYVPLGKSDNRFDVRRSGSFLSKAMVKTPFCRLQIFMNMLPYRLVLFKLGDFAPGTEKHENARAVDRPAPQKKAF